MDMFILITFYFCINRGHFLQTLSSSRGQYSGMFSRNPYLVKTLKQQSAEIFETTVMRCIYNSVKNSDCDKIGQTRLLIRPTNEIN